MKHSELRHQPRHVNPRIQGVYGELPEIKNGADRSSCLKIGTFLVIRKIMEEYNLQHMITKYIGAKDAGLFLDLATYSIITEGNAAQHYPIYAYNHSLFTKKMQ